MSDDIEEGNKKQREREIEGSGGEGRVPEIRPRRRRRGKAPRHSPPARRRRRTRDLLYRTHVREQVFFFSLFSLHNYTDCSADNSLSFCACDKKISRL